MKTICQIAHNYTAPAEDGLKHQIWFELMQLKLYIAQDEERNQCRLEPFQRFPCKNTAPSKTIPSSVHKLRPGDIKVKMATFCIGHIL